MICESFLSHARSKTKLTDSITKRYADGFIGHLPILRLCDLIVNTLIVTLDIPTLNKADLQMHQKTTKTQVGHLKNRCRYLFTALMSLIQICLCLNAEASQGYKLSHLEHKLVNNVATTETKEFIAGKKTLSSEILLKDLVFINAADISNDYEKNEVAGDLKYKNKTILVTGTIKSINSGINDEPFLTLEADNPFTATRVQFRNPPQKLQMIANLRKNEEIKLICIGAGEIVGNPSLRECITPQQFATESNMEDAIKTLFLNFYAGGKAVGTPESISKITDMALAILLLSELPNAHQICPSIKTNCLEDLAKILESCKGDCATEPAKKAKLKMQKARGKSLNETAEKAH